MWRMVVAVRRACQTGGKGADYGCKAVHGSELLATGEWNMIVSGYLGGEVREELRCLLRHLGRSVQCKG